jgi:phosphoribosyl-AMP cyclohydrolase
MQVTDPIERALAEIKFGPDGLVPAIAQQHDTGEVLMMAWMNREAVAQGGDFRASSAVA